MYSGLPRHCAAVSSPFPSFCAELSPPSVLRPVIDRALFCLGLTHLLASTLRQSLLIGYHLRNPPVLVQVGAVLLTAQHAPTEKGQTIFYIIAQFVIGCADPSN